MTKTLTKARGLMRDVPPLVFTLLVLSVVGMNLLANKSINTGVEWLALDCGIILSWLCFLSMDVLTHCFGPRSATAASLIALALNLFMAFIFFIASVIPGAWGESFVEVGGDTINLALDNTFGGTWFIILGSSIAFAVSAVVNNFLNWSIGERLKNKESFATFALRSYVSTFIGQFIDNFTFAMIVSRNFFGWSFVQCVSCAIIGAALELVFEIFFSPLGYQIARRVMAQRDVELSQEVA